MRDSTLTGKRYDVAVLGELLIDFTEAGVSSDGRRLFEQNPGGAVANMASAVCRLGGSAAFIGKVGDDMQGRFLSQTLDAAGVCTKGLVMADDVYTTLAFVALDNGERSFSFARKPGADTCLRTDEIDYDVLDNCALLHVGSLSLSDEPARSATLTAIRYARGKGCLISYDPNYRAPLWPNKQAAETQMRSILDSVDIIKISDEEAALLTGIQDVEQAARALTAGGIQIAVVTLGRSGALVCVGDACKTVSGYEDIAAVDTTGAGDAFWGAFVYRLLLSGKEPGAVALEEAASFAHFANAAATLCVTRRGAIPAMPTLGEVEALMDRYG